MPTLCFCKLTTGTTVLTPKLQMILHPERSSIARAFTGATMTYSGGTLPLLPIDEEDKVLSDSVDHFLDTMNLGF